MSEYLDSLESALSEAVDYALPPQLLAKGILAVLAAMEQPSQKMIKAADNLDEEASPLNDHPATADEIWRAMITAELKDDPA